MTKRWNVYQGAESLGLMTAKEIREALRAGTLDPFDKVAAEGSNIREDLIEVDEIFKETVEEDIPAEDMTQVEAVPRATKPRAEAPQAAAGDGFSVAVARAPSPAPRPSPMPTPPASPSAPAPAQNQSWAPESSINMRRGDSTTIDRDASKNTQKRYYLIDRSKILGPLSALEIQSLFNRGMVNSKVKVQRIGNTRSIPIAQFIASYSEDRLKELTEDGKLQQKMGGLGNPSSKVMNELARAANAQKLAKNRKNKTYYILGVIGVVLGALIFLIFDSGRSRHPDRDDDTPRRESVSKKMSRPKLVQKSPGRETRRPEPEEDEVEEERPEPRREAPLREATREPPRRTPTRAAPQREAPKPVRRATPAPAPAPSRTVAKAAPVRKETPKPAPAAPTRQASAGPGPIARAINAGGGIQNVGPVSFSMSQLEACPSKCDLTFRDSSGASMKGSFFKSAYYDQLRSSSGSVTLTGNIQVNGGSLTMFIQAIR